MDWKILILKLYTLNIFTRRNLDSPSHVQFIINIPEMIWESTENYEMLKYVMCFLISVQHHTFSPMGLRMWAVYYEILILMDDIGWILIQLPV